METINVEDIEKFTEEELIKASHRIKSGKAPEPDRMTPKIIKLAVDAAPKLILDERLARKANISLFLTLENPQV